jgi:hypothetical protein
MLEAAQNLEGAVQAAGVKKKKNKEKRSKYSLVSFMLLVQSRLLAVLECVSLIS